MAATSRLGVRCRVCRSDEWYRNNRGHRFCAVCQRASTKRRMREPAVRLHKWAQKRARETGVTFRITVDDVRAIWVKRCPVFGWGWGRGARAPTLDRIRPDLGYVRGNIAVISMVANQIKSNARARDVEKVARWMRQQGL